MGKMLKAIRAFNCSTIAGISTTSILFLMLILVCQMAPCLAQSMDTGADQTDTSQDDGVSEPSDPSIVNPTNKQGYGRNIQTHVMGTNKPKKSETKPTGKGPDEKRSIGEQSVRAALQFGVLVSSLIIRSIGSSA